MNKLTNYNRSKRWPLRMQIHCLGPRRIGWETYYFDIIGKMFGIVHDNVITLKNDPYNTELREQFPFIIPGYHMNKQHWSSIVVDKTNFLMKGSRAIHDSMIWFLRRWLRNNKPNYNTHWFGSAITTHKTLGRRKWYPRRLIVYYRYVNPL